MKTKEEALESTQNDDDKLVLKRMLETLLDIQELLIKQNSLQSENQERLKNIFDIMS